MCNKGEGRRGEGSREKGEGNREKGDYINLDLNTTALFF